MQSPITTPPPGLFRPYSRGNGQNIASIRPHDQSLTMAQNLWTTQAQNEEIFAEAFAKCQNVILFFSINGSKAFQGYVRPPLIPHRLLPHTRLTNHSPLFPHRHA